MLFSMWTFYPSFYAFSLLHSSDFENKFVCGEIMTYEDLKEHGSETAVKAAGKLRQQGKPYESEFLSFFSSSGPMLMDGSGGRRYCLLEERLMN